MKKRVQHNWQGRVAGARHAVARAARRKAGRPELPALPEKAIRDLTIEAYTNLRLSLNGFGVTDSEQKTAIKQSWALTKAPPISGSLIRDSTGLSSLLIEWSGKPPYLDAKGNPRVLPLKGPGASFESLAREFLPDLPLKDVIDMACENAEVSIRPGGKIALLGGVMVNLAHTLVGSLAFAIRQMDQVLETTLHNAKLGRKGIDEGRMQRFVIGVIPRADRARFMKEFRPQIADFLARVDSSIERRRPKSGGKPKKVSAVSVAVYVSQEDDLERAGVSSTAAVRRKRPRR